ncbi:hypothetical protein TWF730_001657 [Orbilia blumenaviensis]|uniref:Uncharacterized protein n=1 Tax=Orbilia blumenaviensis TaxID=1796055 RepID=A0AAV9UIK1_9PEZI
MRKRQLYNLNDPHGKVPDKNTFLQVVLHLAQDVLVISEAMLYFEYFIFTFAKTVSAFNSLASFFTQ